MTFGRVMVLGGALTCFLGAQQKVVRDWAANPAVVQMDTEADIFAIGDVHGDYDRLLRLLASAKIVEGSPARWKAGKSVLVFTGDLVDKGPKAPAVIAFLRSLREDAARAGGRVVAIMGNHELDFLRNPDSERAKEFSLQLRTAGLDPAAVAHCGGDAGVFLCGLPFAARINGWFFSHAGNTGGRSMAQLIADLQGGVDRDGFDTVQLTGENSVMQARLGAQGPGGKSWFETTGNAEKTLAADAAAVGAAHIVQGHQHAVLRFPDGKQRKLGEVYQWRGRLFLIDVGMSRDIGESAGAVLRMRAGAAGVICPDGRMLKLWDEQKRPAASKGVRCGA